MTSAPANELERRRWNDERWAAEWPKRERMTDEVTRYLLAELELQPGDRVLDIGCGGGKTSIAFARAVGSDGRVVGADLSGPLAALAAQRAEEAGADNVTFQIVDMQTDSVEGGPFDVATSQFGVMFFDEPVTAFTNIHSHLTPGGRIGFMCWQSLDRNPWFFGNALVGLVPPPPEPAPGKSPTGPFALADPDRTTGILESAGFDEVRRKTYEIDIEAPEDSVVDEAQLVFMGIPADKLGAASAAVEAYMKQFRTGTGNTCRLPVAFQLFSARA